MTERVIFILGGARSGKSRFAQELAGKVGERVLFVATAEPLDEDMRSRIVKHREERPSAWRTLELSTGLAAGIREHLSGHDVVLIDCLTLLVSNLLLGRDRGLAEAVEVPSPEEAEQRMASELDSLLDLMRTSQATFVLISNEVGLGLVPDNQLGRLYRDLLGRANQLLARDAHEVYFMAAGIPMKIKG